MDELQINIEQPVVEIAIEQPHIVIEMPGTQGPPGPPGVGASPGDFSREHIQTIASDTWTIDHNLGFKPNVQIEDSAGDSVIPQSISHNGVNQSVISFMGAMGGKAYCS